MKKAGQIIHEHNQKKIDIEDDVIEYRRAMEPEIIKSIHDTVAAALTKDRYKRKPFYVVFTMIIDPLLNQPIIRTWARMSCPTPVYKQSVWKYHHASGSLEFLWSIPDRILYYGILANKTKYLMDKECEGLAKMVILMESGELLDWVKKENGENKIDNIVLSIN